MAGTLEVLIASRSKEAVDSLAGALRSCSAHRIATRHIQNGHVDPLHGIAAIPDVVVLLLGPGGRADLDALIGENRPGGPPLIVVAAEGDAELMRLAMRAGARDFVSGALPADELVESLQRITLDAGERPARASRGGLTVFVNAKGGSGATFLACNTAHVLCSVAERPTALLSLDLQFDGLAQYFDTELRHGLMEVLDSVDSLDHVALDAYMTQHASGLRILAAVPENVIQCHSERATQLANLVEKMQTHYDHVVIDIPRRIDAYIVPVLERADRVVLVVQQTLSHLRDAKRMLQIFENYGISSSQVLVVVNRYAKGSPISTEDIQRALRGTEVSLVPSDFNTVAESINLGIPMHQHARGSAVTRSLQALAAKLGGHAEQTSPSLLGKAFSSILRKDKWQRTQAK